MDAHRSGTSTVGDILVVVMGVSGSGKSTVGELLAPELGVEYADADDFHAPENVAKMSAGIPLTDEDRGPWLDAIGRWLAEHEATGGVVTCSALKRRYRDVLRQHAADVWFLHCDSGLELITDRIAERTDHFMPGSLLESQFAALEPPGSDERAVRENASQQPSDIVAHFLAEVSRRTAG